MVSGLDWVGLGGSAAVVGVNYLCWGVCTLEHGVQLAVILPSGII
jgi:hypothetical protein